MRLFANVSYFIAEYAKLPQFCIWVLLIFWATQFYAPIAEKVRQDNTIEWKNQDYVSHELRKLAIQIENEAIGAGELYSPQRYFAHMKMLDGKRIDLNRRYGTSGHYLITATTNGIFNENIIRKGRYAPEEATKCSDEYAVWRAQNDPLYPKRGNVFDPGTLPLVLNWMHVLYVRGLFLALLLYLVSMHAEKGIVQTILADKKKFFFAIVAWPLFILRYPANVVREIVVEAEIRRMGSVFRRLSAAEKQLVKAVANGMGYREWIASFRITNGAQFQRSLLFAIVITLAIHLVLPRQSEARQSDCVRAGPEISMQYGGLQNHCSNLASRAEYISGGAFVYMPPLFRKEKFRDVAMSWNKIFCRPIDHVPLEDCLVIS